MAVVEMEVLYFFPIVDKVERSSWNKVQPPHTAIISKYWNAVRSYLRPIFGEVYLSVTWSHVLVEEIRRWHIQPLIGKETAALSYR